jgi:hypothetical protein
MSGILAKARSSDERPEFVDIPCGTVVKIIPIPEKLTSKPIMCQSRTKLPPAKGRWV